MDDKKRNKIFLLFLILAEGLGIVCNIFNEAYIFIPLSLAASCMGIVIIYFAYGLAKGHNRTHAFWHERDNNGGEPSDWSISRYKIRGWALYIMALLMAFVPNFNII
ncbi:MAG: hypothetical protein IJX87_02600 [Clostridia bacterium]|nr:hypothetical protein [Clostridia bacterium]